MNPFDPGARPDGTDPSAQQPKPPPSQDNGGGDLADGVGEVAESDLESLGGCAGFSLALLLVLFACAGTAVAVFR